MLTYEDFKQKLVEEILNYLPLEYSEYDVSISEVVKNNNSVNEALIIKQNDLNIAPTIYIKSYYEDYCCGDSFDAVCSKIAGVRIDAQCCKTFDTDKILDIDAVRDYIYIGLVNLERNSEVLMNRPHREFLDLAIVYYIDITKVDDNCKGMGCLQVVITDDLMEQYRMNEEELYELAMKNTNDIKPKCKYLHDIISSSFQSEDSILEDIPGIKNYNVMYLTNENNCKGSAMVFNNKVLNYASEKLGGDYYILPSSIHELILVSALADMPKEAMYNMVHEVNMNSVCPEDYLSDSIYYYDSSDQKIYMMVE